MGVGDRAGEGGVGGDSAKTLTVEAATVAAMAAEASIDFMAADFRQFRDKGG